MNFPYFLDVDLKAGPKEINKAYIDGFKTDKDISLLSKQDLLAQFKEDLLTDFLMRLESLGHSDVADAIRQGRYAVKDLE